MISDLGNLHQCCQIQIQPRDIYHPSPIHRLAVFWPNRVVGSPPNILFASIRSTSDRRDFPQAVSGKAARDHRS